MIDLKSSLVRSVRSATEEVNRRLEPRHPLSRHCTVEGFGGQRSGEVVDISRKGAALKLNEPLPGGAGGTLIIDGLPAKLSFQVRRTSTESPPLIGVEFNLQPATEAELDKFLQKLPPAGVAKAA